MGLAERITRCIEWFYRWPLTLVVTRQLFRYAVCGGITYLLLDPILYYLIYHYLVAERFFDLGVVVLSPHIAAMLLLFPITFWNGFWLNRHVAFRHSPVRTRSQLFRYLLSIGGSVLLTYLCMKLFVEVCAIWPTPAKVLTTMVTMVYSFLAAKYFTFRNAEA